MFTKLVGRLISIVFPVSRWYKAAFLFTKYYAKFSKAPYQSYVRDRFGHSEHINHSLKLETLLARMTDSAKKHTSFPIPMGAEKKLAERLKSEWPNGLLLCTIHNPLNLIGVRYALTKGLIIDGIIARYPPEGGYFTITGTSIRIPAIPVDSKVLIRVKTILKRGGIVIACVDNLADGSFSPNQFRLAEMLNADIMLVLVTLLPDGTIQSNLIETPDFDGENVVEWKIKHMSEQVFALLER